MATIEANYCNGQIESDVKFTLEALLSRFEANLEFLTTTTINDAKQIVDVVVSPSHCVTSKQNNFHNENKANNRTTASKTELANNKSDANNKEEGYVFDDDENRPKDIVTLRNLEITPPPTLPSDEPDTTSEASTDRSENKKRCKRKYSESTELSADGSVSSATRSKRERRQTQLFQVGSEPKVVAKSSHVSKEKSVSSRRRSSSSRAKSPESPKADPEVQDVIIYEKNDYLAIRNEENSFFLCQLAENVRLERPERHMIKVRWLDTKNDGETYFLTPQYDKIPRQSIIMPVHLKKLNSKSSGQLFALEETHKESVTDRLKRCLSLNTETPLLELSDVK